MAASRVVLWRHGRTTYNAESRFQGQSDVPLDDVGLGQAERAAEDLAELLRGETVTIVSSDLVRASTTADQLGRLLGLPVARDARLREFHAGEWQGLLRDEIVARWPENYAAWRAGAVDERIGGDGETVREAAERAAAAIREHAERVPEGALVVASHGAALRGAIFRLLGLFSPEMPMSALEALRNAHWAEMRPSEARWRLSTYNVGAS